MDEDFAALGVQKPDYESARTTRCGVLEMIRRLEGARHRLPGGKARREFLSPKFPGYGKLSGKSLEDLRAGEAGRVDANQARPARFRLWKRAKEASLSGSRPGARGVRAGTSSAPQ